MAAIQVLPEGLAVVDSGIIVFANPAWAQRFECADPSEIQGRPLRDFVPGLSPTPISGPSAREEILSTDQCSYLQHNGTRVQLEIARVAFRLQGREFEVVSAHGVSPRKSGDQQFREAQGLEAVGRLAGGVAHDFNNLLTGIVLYCDLLIGELAKGSRPRHRVEEIRKAGEYGARLVHQLLAVARPQAVESSVVAINDIVTRIEELLKRLIGENIVLCTSLAADLGLVRTDPAHVQQILLNLVLNARDAMPEGGQLTIATQNCAHHFPSMEPERSSGNSEEVHEVVPSVELTVSDTGCGMDNEILGRAFEPFFTTKKNGQGNGLGLSTARRLATSNGGTILAESQPGLGTQVSLLLPRFNPDKPFDSPGSDTKVER